MNTKPIALIGFYGCGKTSLARQVAREMEVPFQDLSAAVERLGGNRMILLYQALGESSVRELEHLALSASAAIGGVLSTTGGCVMMPNNRRILLDHFTTFFLDVPFEYAYDRRDTASNPSVNSLTKDELYLLYTMRRPLYLETAHHRIDGVRDTATLVDEIVNLGLSD